MKNFSTTLQSENLIIIQAKFFAFHWIFVCDRKQCFMLFVFGIVSSNINSQLCYWGFFGQLAWLRFNAKNAIIIILKKGYEIDEK